MFPSPLFPLAAVTLLAGLTMPARADLFVSSFTQNSVRRYDETTGAFLGTFITAGSGGLSAPHRGIYGLDGHFYVASANNDRVLRYHGQTGEFMDVFIENGTKKLPLNALDYPVDLTFGPDGALYVSSQLNDSILRFDGATGAFIDVFVPLGSGGLDGPSGLQFHEGDLFVAGRFSQAAYRYDGTTGAFELAMGSGALETAFGLDFGPGGNLYVASGGNSRVYRFDPATGENLGSFVTAGSGGLSVPIGVEFGPDGNLYVASFNTHSIKEYSGTTGNFVGDFVGPGSGALAAPNYITFAVPEPSTGLLLAGSAMAVLACRGRRRLDAL